MKRNHFSSFLFGMITVTLGSIGVFAINTSYFKNDGSLDFSQLKSTANGNKLTQAMRDSLIEGLSRQNTSNASIPAGAVMAFNLTSCPDGWRRFSEADGRFIMGTSNNIRSRGGTGSIMMKANQLAPHSHWFVDTIYSTDVLNYNLIRRDGMFARADAVIDRFSGNGWGGSMRDRSLVESNAGYLVTAARRTGMRIVNGDDFVYTGNLSQHQQKNIMPGSQAFGGKNGIVDQEWVGAQQPLNILNPYVKLLYCQKN